MITCHGEEIFIPNVFSPPDDHVNDIFTVSFSSLMDIQSMHADIFDRWGNMVSVQMIYHLPGMGDIKVKF